MAARSLDQIVETVLFASEDALSAERIAAALERKDATPAAVREVVERLNEDYRRTERAFEIVEVAGGYKLMTLPEFNIYVRRVLRSRSRDRLSQAAMETLAIVAYRQPVTRAEIENIRGVEAGPVLRMLVDRGVVRIVGRQQSLGHPLLYGTSKAFLELFGLRNIESLPRTDELTAGMDAAPADSADDDVGDNDEQALTDEELDETVEPRESAEALSSAMAALSDEPQPAGDAGDAADEDNTEQPSADGAADDDGAEPSPADDDGAARPDEGQTIIRLANHQDAPPPEESPGNNEPDNTPPDTPTN